MNDKKTCRGCKYLASKSETAGCEIVIFCNRLDTVAGPHGLVLGDEVPERCEHYDDSGDTREWSF